MAEPSGTEEDAMMMMRRTMSLIDRPLAEMYRRLSQLPSSTAVVAHEEADIAA